MTQFIGEMMQGSLLLKTYFKNTLLGECCNWLSTGESPEPELWRFIDT